MYIRWIGSFRKNGSLFESIQFEMSRETSVACEILQSGKSYIDFSRVGLLVDPSAVYKRFKGDVWSEYNTNGNLYQKRRDYQAPTKSKHREAWAKPPCYTGIVIKGGDFCNLSDMAKDQVTKAVNIFNLPLYRLSKGKLIEIKL